jgi:5'-deoxynucleotidase YfbR-like HD superfamily hydrolase
MTRRSYPKSIALLAIVSELSEVKIRSITTATQEKQDDEEANVKQIAEKGIQRVSSDPETTRRQWAPVGNRPSWEMDGRLAGRGQPAQESPA